LDWEKEILLKAQGIKVIRIPNKEIFEDIEKVIHKINEKLF
jgi:very-short-patch-repair endonuclease